MEERKNQYLCTEFIQQQLQNKEYRWLIIDFHRGIIKKSPIFVLPTVTYSIAMMYRGNDLVILFSFRRNPYGGYLSVRIKLLTYNFLYFIDKNNREIVYPDIREIEESRFEVVFQITHIYPVTQKLLDIEPKRELTIMKYISPLYLSIEFHDLIIYVEDLAFPVHKFILASQSTVFKNIFDFEAKRDRKEKSYQVSKRLYITEIKKDIFITILRYIYTNKIEITDHIANTIICAAVMYEIHSLIKLCKHILIEHVNIENVFDSILIADKCNFCDLETYCFEFILRNKKIIPLKKEYAILKKNSRIVEKLINFLSN